MLKIWYPWIVVQYVLFDINYRYYVPSHLIGTMETGSLCHFVHQFLHSSVYHPVHPSIPLSAHLSFYLSVHSATCVSVCLSSCPSYIIMISVHQRSSDHISIFSHVFEQDIYRYGFSDFGNSDGIKICQVSG